MRRNRHSRLSYAVINDINLTNLIDVTMVILVIYILIAPLVKQGINVNLPKASASRINSEETITVTVSKEGNLYLGSTQVSLTQLKEKLIYKIKKRPQTTVILKADKALRYGTVIKTLDTLNMAGITRIGMATEIVNRK